VLKIKEMEDKRIMKRSRKDYDPTAAGFGPQVRLENTQL
jgi:hypothetical protein